jgi:hypothetical protein
VHYCPDAGCIIGKAGVSPALSRNGNIRKNKARIPALILLVQLLRSKGGRAFEGMCFSSDSQNADLTPPAQLPGRVFIIKTASHAEAVSCFHKEDRICING